MPISQEAADIFSAQDPGNRAFYQSRVAKPSTSTPSTSGGGGGSSYSSPRISDTNASGQRYAGSDYGWVSETKYKSLVDAGTFTNTTPPKGYVGGTYNPVTGETTGGHPSEASMAIDRSYSSPEQIALMNKNTYTTPDTPIAPLPSGKYDIPIVSVPVNTSAPYFQSTEGQFYNLTPETTNAVIDKINAVIIPEGYTREVVPYVAVPTTPTRDIIDRIIQDSKTGSVYINDMFIPSASMRAVGFKLTDTMARDIDIGYLQSQQMAKDFFATSKPTPEASSEPAFTKSGGDTVKALSFGGFIGDFTSGYASLLKGDVGGLYSNVTQAFSRYSTRLIPEPTGFGDYINKFQVPSSFKTPFGFTIKTPIATLQKSVPYGAEQFIQDVRKDPIQDVLLLGMSGMFKTAEYGSSLLRAGAVKSSLPVVPTIGKITSTPLAVDVTSTAWTGAKLLMGGAYAASAVSTYSKAEGTEAKARAGGDIAYQLGLMGVGGKYFTPKYTAPVNEALGRTMSGEMRMGPIESTLFSARTGVRSFLTASPSAYRDVATITKAARWEEAPVKAEPVLDILTTSGKYSAPIKEVLIEQPHSMIGSGSLKQQYPESTAISAGLRTGKDVDVLIESPELALSSLSLKTGLSRAGAENVLDVHPIPELYPGMKASTEIFAEKPESSFLTNLFGDAYSKIAFPRSVTEVIYGKSSLFPTKGYSGDISYEASQVQFGRKGAAVAAVIENPLQKGYRAEKDIYDFVSIYSAQKTTALARGVSPSAFKASDKAMADLMTRQLEFGTVKGQRTVTEAPTVKKTIGEMFESGKKSVTEAPAPKYVAKIGYLSNVKSYAGSIAPSGLVLNRKSYTSQVKPSTIRSLVASKAPSTSPSRIVSMIPSIISKVPSVSPSKVPSRMPSVIPSRVPSISPSKVPSRMPSIVPSKVPSFSPIKSPFKSPSPSPSPFKSVSPSPSPFKSVSPSPSPFKSVSPSPSPFRSSPPSPIPSTVIVPPLRGQDIGGGGAGSSKAFGKKVFTEISRYGQGGIGKQLKISDKLTLNTMKTKRKVKVI